MKLHVKLFEKVVDVKSYLSQKGSVDQEDEIHCIFGGIIIINK